MKKRLSIAYEIDRIQHKANNRTQSNEWFLNAAEELDVDLDDDLIEVGPTLGCCHSFLPGVSISIKGLFHRRRLSKILTSRGTSRLCVPSSVSTFESRSSNHT